MKFLKLFLWHLLLMFFSSSLQAVVQPVKNDLTNNTVYKKKKKASFLNRLLMKRCIKKHQKHLKKKKRKSVKKSHNKVKFGMWAWITLALGFLLAGVTQNPGIGAFLFLGAIVWAIIGLKKDEKKWLAKAFIILAGVLFLIGIFGQLSG